MNAAININRAGTPDPAATAACREVCRKQARGLFLASFFLPKSKRDAVYAVSAFGWLLQAAFEKPSSPDDNMQDRIDLFRDRLGEFV